MTKSEPIRSSLRTYMMLWRGRCSVSTWNAVNYWKDHLPEKRVNAEESRAERWEERKKSNASNVV